DLFDRTDVEAWQHAKLTVTNCSFGLTIKFTVDTKFFRVARQYSRLHSSSYKFWVTTARGTHPFPSRTRKLSLSAPMVLHARVCGRLGSRPVISKSPTPKGRAFSFLSSLAPAYQIP